MIQIECWKLFVNTAFGRLRLIIYNQLIENKERSFCNNKSVLLLAFYGTMKVTDTDCSVVNFTIGFVLPILLPIAVMVVHVAMSISEGIELSMMRLCVNIKSGWTSCEQPFLSRILYCVHISTTYGDIHVFSIYSLQIIDNAHKHVHSFCQPTAVCIPAAIK